MKKVGGPQIKVGGPHVARTVLYPKHNLLLHLENKRYFFVERKSDVKLNRTVIKKLICDVFFWQSPVVVS
jgi:hypothetical protein